MGKIILILLMIGNIFSYLYGDTYVFKGSVIRGKVTRDFQFYRTDMGTFICPSLYAVTSNNVILIVNEHDPSTELLLFNKGKTNLIKKIKMFIRDKKGNAKKKSKEFNMLENKIKANSKKIIPVVLSSIYIKSPPEHPLNSDRYYVYGITNENGRIVKSWIKEDKRPYNGFYIKQERKFLCLGHKINEFLNYDFYMNKLDKVKIEGGAGDSFSEYFLWDWDYYVDNHGNFYEIYFASDPWQNKGTDYYNAPVYWWVWEWKKSYYLPVETKRMVLGKYFMSKYKGRLVFLERNEEKVIEGKHGIKLEDYKRGNIDFQIDKNGNFYLIATNRVMIYNGNGKLIKRYFIRGGIEKCIFDNGCKLKYFDKKGNLKFVKLIGNRKKEIGESEFNYKGWRVDKRRIFAPDKSFDVAGIDIKHNGKSIRLFKYGENDRMIDARILGIDKKGYIWVKTLRYDGLDEETRGEIIKFNKKGEYQNRIFLDKKTGYKNPRESTVVNKNDAELYQLNGSSVIKYEKEKIKTPPLSESRKRIIEYLNTKKYAGNIPTHHKALHGTVHGENGKLFEGINDVLEDLVRLDIPINQLLINEIYARHGYVFKTKKWREIFRHVRWYKPVNGKVRLSKTELENIKKMKENSF